MRVISIVLAATMLWGVNAESSEVTHADNAYCSLNGLSLWKSNMKLHAPSPQAKKLLQSIVDKIGIENDFRLHAASFKGSTPLAFADIKGRSVRRIVYDRDIFDVENGLDYTFVSVIGHEIGHHINSDLAGINRPNHTQELRADYFGGYVVQVFGGSRADAITITKHFSDEGSKSHPPKDERIAAFLAGWKHGQRMQGKKYASCNSDWISPAFEKDGRTCRIAAQCGNEGAPVRFACQSDTGAWNWVK